MKERNVSFSIRKSILSLIGNVVIVDIFFLVLFSVVSIILENSEVRLSLDKESILFIDIATTVIFSLVQTFLILVVTYNWKSIQIKINKSEIIYIHGFWKINTEIIPFTEIEDIVVSKNVVQELLNIGKVTFKLRDKNRKFSLENVDRISEYVGRLNAVKSIITKNSKITQILPVEKIIEGGESDSVELKSSIYYDYSTKQPNKALTETVMKSIVGFLNYQGGNLIIGVDDAGKILGIKNDFGNFRKKNSDGFEQFFNNMFMQMIGAEYRTYVKLTFHKIDGEEVCMIRVLPSDEPAFLKRNGSEEFFVRTGNTTNPLKTREMYNYLRLHW